MAQAQLVDVGPVGFQRAGDRRWAAIAGVLAIAGGVALVVIHYVGGGPHYADDPEGWYASIAFGAPFVAAGVLAVLGVLLDAGWLWWSAGAVLVACSIVSFVMFPLIAVGIVLIVAGRRARSTLATTVCGLLFATALGAVFAVLVFHQDPATWAGGGSSNIITTVEATLSVVVSSAVVVAGAVVAGAVVASRTRD